jgi:predicted ATPase
VLGAVAHRDTNLPAPRGRLFGRDEELATLRELVLHADGRLVTLTGTGGIGKTSLALEAARRLHASMPDGAWLVTLEAVEEPRRVALHIAQALGLTGSAQLPEDTLLDFLEPRQALLVLDDCDEVVEPTAVLVDRLLDRCPDLRVLVTCRTRLKVRGESVLVVAPVAVPPREGLDAASLARVPSVELFVERAREARPGFRLDGSDASDVSTICRRLDGIPLAIELAAAQAAVLSPAEIAERLPGLDALAAAIDVSLGLLPDDAIRLFRRLAVFAGGWTVAAAEAIGSSSDDASA